MQVEIIGTDGKVHYRRPHNHPDVLEAFNTPGYSVRGNGVRQSIGKIEALKIHIEQLAKEVEKSLAIEGCAD